MSLPFSLQLPADARYRVLATEIASRYAEVSGGTSGDGQALATALVDALDRVVKDTGPDATLDLKFQPGPAGVEVTVRCEDRSTVVRHALPASKG